MASTISAGPNRLLARFDAASRQLPANPVDKPPRFPEPSPRQTQRSRCAYSRALHGRTFMLKSRIAAAIVGSLMWGGSALAQDTIKVGAALPMSGPNAELGEIFSRAASIAVKHINADKMLSKPLELAIEDSLATPQGGVVAMNKLVSVAKVPWVLSAYTAVSKAIAPIGDRAKVVSINGGAVGPDVAEAKGGWCTVQSADFNASALGQRVAKEYKEMSGKDANAYVANYYNAVMVFGILAQQLEKAGKPITGVNLLEQRRASPTFELVGGKMTFQANGTVAAPVQIREVDGTGAGKLVK